MLQGSGILCTMLQRWVAKLDEYGTQANSGTLKNRLNKVADPYTSSHFDADPEPLFHFWCGSGSLVKCESATTAVQTYQGSILNLYTFIVSI